MLRVLLLEDTKERQDVLTQLYRAHAWVLVWTASRALTLLEAFEFDIVSLDYNLRGEQTGDTVARALAASKSAHARIVIHSMNPRGSAQISQILPTAVVYPVSRMMASNARFKRLRAMLDLHGAAFDWDAPEA